MKKSDPQVFGLKSVKVITILGTRPEIIKLSPLIPLLDQNFQQIIIHTGQHYSYNMDKIFFEEMRLRAPDYMLNVGSGMHAQQTGKMMIEIEKIVLAEKPDLILVQGDTNTTLAGALVAAKMHVPLAHVESGSRSHNLRMPEEINRIITDKLSQFLFTNDDGCVQNLLHDGIDPRTIHVVGNTALDAVRINEQYAKEGILSQLHISREGYVLVTIHRAENTEDAATLNEIVTALNYISSRIQLVFPLHPRTKKALDQYGASLSPAIKVIEPTGYLEFIALMKNALFIMTDSGGILRESAVLNVPGLILRNEVEATEVLRAGKIRLTSTKSGNIIKHANALLDDPSEIKRIKSLPHDSAYDISQKIVSVLCKELGAS